MTFQKIPSFPVGSVHDSVCFANRWPASLQIWRKLVLIKFNSKIPVRVEREPLDPNFDTFSYGSASAKGKGLSREQVSRTKKEHLHQTAVGLFQKNGYEGTAIAQISKASCMAIGSIYHFYTGKSDFLCRLGHALFKEAWTIPEDDKAIPADVAEMLLIYYQCIARQMDRGLSSSASRLWIILFTFGCKVYNFSAAFLRLPYSVRRRPKNSDCFSFFLYPLPFIYSTLFFCPPD